MTYVITLPINYSDITVKRMLSFGVSGEKLITAITSDSPTINHKIMIGLFTGLNPLNPSSPLTSRKMYEIGDANTRYFVDEIIK